MSDKHTAPWHSARAIRDDGLLYLELFDSDDNVIPSDEAASAYNALAAERDECLRQNAAMVEQLKESHDKNELTRAKLRRAVEAMRLQFHWHNDNRDLCMCDGCGALRSVLAENAELLEETR